MDTEKPDPSLCKSCHKRPAQADHACPLKEEIEDDHKTLCNCCTKCAHECAMDI